MLAISHPLMAQMHVHLESGYPHEACGILIGDVAYDNVGANPSVRPPGDRPTTKIVKDLVLVPNVWDVESDREGLHNRYLISPEDVARADREAGKRGWDIVGFFHSHPDHPSQPSETDREFAWPVVSFVIVSVQQGRADTTQSWVLRDDRSKFDEEAIVAE